MPDGDEIILCAKKAGQSGIDMYAGLELCVMYPSTLVALLLEACERGAKASRWQELSKKLSASHDPGGAKSDRGVLELYRRVCEFPGGVSWAVLSALQDPGQIQGKRWQDKHLQAKQPPNAESGSEVNSDKDNADVPRALLPEEAPKGGPKGGKAINASACADASSKSTPLTPSEMPSRTRGAAAKSSGAGEAGGASGTGRRPSSKATDEVIGKAVPTSSDAEQSIATNGENGREGSEARREEGGWRERSGGEVIRGANNHKELGGAGVETNGSGRLAAAPAPAAPAPPDPPATPATPSTPAAPPVPPAPAPIGRGGEAGTFAGKKPGTPPALGGALAAALGAAEISGGAVRKSSPAKPASALVAAGVQGKQGNVSVVGRSLDHHAHAPAVLRSLDHHAHAPAVLRVQAAQSLSSGVLSKEIEKLLGVGGLEDWESVAKGRERIERCDFIEVLVTYLRRGVKGVGEGADEDEDGDEERREIAGMMLEQSRWCMGKDALSLRDYCEFLREEVVEEEEEEEEEGSKFNGRGQAEGQRRGGKVGAQVVQSIDELIDCVGKVSHSDASV